MMTSSLQIEEENGSLWGQRTQMGRDPCAGSRHAQEGSHPQGSRLLVACLCMR